MNQFPCLTPLPFTFFEFRRVHGKGAGVDTKSGHFQLVEHYPNELGYSPKCCSTTTINWKYPYHPTLRSTTILVDYPQHLFSRVNNGSFLTIKERAGDSFKKKFKFSIFFFNSEKAPEGSTLTIAVESKGLARHHYWTDYK